METSISLVGYLNYTFIREAVAEAAEGLSSQPNIVLAPLEKKLSYFVSKCKLNKGFSKQPFKRFRNAP